jgi:CCR4-NOT transcriptional regulation complex NOT5 subunit
MIIMYFIRCLIDIDDEEEEYEFLHKSSSSSSSSSSTSSSTSNDASSLSLRDNVMKGSRMKEMKVYGDVGIEWLD